MKIYIFDLFNGICIYYAFSYPTIFASQDSKFILLIKHPCMPMIIRVASKNVIEIIDKDTYIFITELQEYCKKTPRLIKLKYTR